MNAQRIAERVARESYGRLVALLSTRSRDVAAAEDALSEAFAAALTAWPRGGVPDNPEAWLFAAAKRKLIDAGRRADTALANAGELTRSIEAREADALVAGGDRRLNLMFACTHPAIDANARTPMMLQTVLGFSADRIAAAFLVEPAAMSQRLVRAKKRLREQHAVFDVPPPELWAERVSAVLGAVYAAYTAGWSDPLGADPDRAELAEEAIWLGQVLAVNLPHEPEVLGLLALMLHLEARRPARRDAQGRYVPLEEQDARLWTHDLQEQAERLLRNAATFERPGRFQLEAAIQSAHAARASAGRTDWDALVLLYNALADLLHSPAAHLNAIAARARRDGPTAGIELLAGVLDRFPALASYQPYWALRADLCARLERADEARLAYDEAIARERDPAVISFLSARRAGLA